MESGRTTAMLVAWAFLTSNPCFSKRATARIPPPDPKNPLSKPMPSPKKNSKEIPPKNKTPSFGSVT